MNRLTVLPLLLPVAAAACSGGNAADKAVLVSADGKYRVLHVADAKWNGELAKTEMESVLERLPRIDLVYAHNDPMAKGAYEACRQKGRTDVKFVGIDGLAGEGRKYVADGVLDATFEYTTCAEAAIDLALLAHGGVAFPKERRDFRLGTRAFTRANLAEGGARHPSPGEVLLEAARRENAALLRPDPDAKSRIRIGMAQCTDNEPWRVAMREDLIAAAKRYPQVEFSYRAADDDTEKQRGIVADFVAQGFQAILVSPKESRALASACKEALAKHVPVIVIDRELGSDDYTCFVGGSNLEIGKAAGFAIRDLLPDGGAIVELEGLMTSSPAQERHKGFVEALQLAPPK
jgi:ABC-type sugar transport system substrate-binding protein